MVIITALQSRD